MKASAPAQVLVKDPHGYWRGESLSGLGCGAGHIEPYWGSELAGAGDSPRQAVDDVLANFTRLDPAAYSGRPAEVGYVGAATQTWVATKNGRPNMTIKVARAGARFSAWPAFLCGPT